MCWCTWIALVLLVPGHELSICSNYDSLLDEHALPWQPCSLVAILNRCPGGLRATQEGFQSCIAAVHTTNMGNCGWWLYCDIVMNMPDFFMLLCGTCNQQTEAFRRPPLRSANLGYRKTILLQKLTLTSANWCCRKCLGAIWWNMEMVGNHFGEIPEELLPCLLAEDLSGHPS